MADSLRILLGFRQGALIQSCFKDGLDTSEAEATNGQSSTAGSFKSFLPIVLPEAHDAEAGTETLLSMWA